MNIKNIIRNNAKLYMILSIIILFGTIGISLAVLTSNFNAIGINTNMLEIDADISYDESSNGEEITSTGNMLPISDDLVTGPNVTDSRVLKATFNVTGNNNNPDNTIYDIALHNVEVDCALRTKDLKWRLYKNNKLISREDASLSPTFDTIDDGRLVLTETQQDLTTSTDKYTFLLWISESCDGNITECDSSMDQSDYLGKEFSASIKVELSTKNKKEISRITGSEDSCYYTEVEVPVCNTLTYDGTNQTLISSDNTKYTLTNTTGVNAGTYNITAKLADEYKWSNGSTDDKVLTCNINKKDVTVTTLNQTTTYGNNISSTVTDVSLNGLIETDVLNKVSLTSDTVEVGTGKISSNNIKIVNSVGTDVTSNYNIIKNNAGIVTINCANISEEPNVENKEYTGEEVTGITGGKYITISGNKSATEIGEYKVTAVPNKNYCWSDKTTSKKEYTWEIESTALNIEIEDKNTIYTGEEIEIDKAVVTDANGKVVTDIPITYKYYSGTSCTGDALSSAPINVGSYSVKASIEKTESYPASESNCAKLTITKASGSVSTSTDSLSLTYPTNGSFTYTYIGDGSITCSSSSDSIATCAVDTTNKKVTVTPVASGSATITVTLAQGTNYTGASDTVSVSIGKGTLSGSVTISGTNTYNQTLTANVTNTNSASLSYQWYSNSTNSTSGGTAISGATSSTYKIGSGLVGKYIYVVVSASKTNYNSTTWSAKTSSTVARATGRISASTDSLSLTYPTANSFTYTYTGDGSVSCSSSSTSIATCSVDTTNKKVTVTPVATGSAVVTVTLAAGTNYAGASDTVSISITYDTYTITLNNQSATSAGTTTLYGRYSDGIYLDSSYSKKMTTSANAITKPTRTGYTFGGYYTSTGGSGTQLINSSGYITSSFTTTKYSNNVTLYAKWTASSYYVTYDYATNGGTSATKTSATVSYGNSIDLSPTAAKSGWTFVGWNTNSSATTALSSLTMETSSVKLYAIYRKEAITYTATTQKNVSSATGTAKTVSCQIPAVYNTATQNTRCSITLPSNPYTLTNWTFNGWVKSTGTTTTTTSGTVVNGTMTLTGDTNIVATWKKNVTVYLTFDKNGGSANTTSAGVTKTLYNGSTTISGSLTFTAPSATTYSGWTFLGYNTSSTATTSAWSAGSTKSISLSGTVAIGATTYTQASGYYHIWRKSSGTAYFYYYNGSAQTYTTTSCYMYNGASSCNFTVPSAVTSSTGLSSASYYGVATSNSSSSVVTSYPSSNLTYYAVYRGTWTASYAKGTGVSAIGSTSSSCYSYKMSNGSSYGYTSCNVTLPTITASSGYTALGWYNSSSTKVGNAGDSLSLTANATYTAKAQVSGPAVGDYVSYTPSISFFDVNKSLTGYTGSESQRIYPSELTLWRVLNNNSDGTIEIISEYVSSTDVYFEGKYGYLNLVGYLNDLAAQYETSGITSGSRHFGYNGQTEYLATGSFTNPAPWECSTGGRTCNPDPDDYEEKGGGDKLYTTDYDRVYTVLGTRVANKVGTSTATWYWMASRYYIYSSSTLYAWCGRNVNTSGSLSYDNLYLYNRSSFNEYNRYNALRPIVTLKSGLRFTGSGTSASPYVIT